MTGPAMSSNRLLADRNLLGAVGIVCAIVTFLAVNLFAGASLTDQRVDLTENRLYSISAGTRDLIARTAEPITLRLYVSPGLLEALPRLRGHLTRVREVLDTFSRLSDERIRVEYLEVEPFSPEEDRAVVFGLRGVVFNTDGDRGYLGLVGTNSTDDVDAIPFLTPERERFLEYDLTRLIHNLANPEKPVVALIERAQMSGGPTNQFREWLILNQLRQFYDLRILGGDVQAIPEDVDVVWLVHPQALSRTTLYAIDQFVVGGGSALVFLDGHFEEQPFDPQQGPMARLTLDSASPLSALTAAWGLELEDRRVAGDVENALRVQYNRGQIIAEGPFAPWIALDGDHWDADDPVTGRLDRLHFLSAGSLIARDGATTTLQPLVTTGDNSGTIPVQAVKFQPSPDTIAEDITPSETPIVLAARITGTVESAFPQGPDGPVPGDEVLNEDADPEAEPPEGHLAVSRNPINLIVVSDTDMLTDRAWVQVSNLSQMLGQQVGVPISDNANFLINALDNLRGDPALIGLRGRRVADRSFSLVDDIRADAEARHRARELELLEELETTESRIREMGGEERDGRAVLSAEQQQAIREFRQRALEIRSELRDVQLALRRDIELLETRLQLFTIAAMPSFVALIALILAIVRWRNAHRPRPVGG